MMIHAGDQWIQYPVKDIYNTQLMAMAINAAKDMYEKGLKLIDDFYDKYGDFTSPIQKDMDWYNQNVTGRARDFINNLYANGVDPLRSAEGRAAVQLLIYSMPVGDIARVKQSAEVAKEYLKSFDDTTNPDLERFLGRDLSSWSTLGDPINGIKADGVWGANKATKYQTIDDLIEPIVKNIDYTYDDAMTKARNDGNNYYSITRDRLMLAVNDNMSDILATPSGRFHWEQAKNAAAQRGGGEELARSIFNTMIGNRLSDHERVKFEADPFKLDNYRTANDIRAHAANAATDYAYKIKEATDPRLHGGDDETERGYNIPEDVYITSLAKSSDKEYLPRVGLRPEVMDEMLKTAKQKQDDAINKGKSVLSATGAFISPQKIAGLIQADDKDEDGYFLNRGYFKNLHDLTDISTSYKGWGKKGATKNESDSIKKANKQRSKTIVSAARDFMAKNNKGDDRYRIRVVLTVDENGNNTYSMVGDDNKWHTYALVRVYMSDGKTTKDAGKLRSLSRVDETGKRGWHNEYDIPAAGRLMGLEIGLNSNEGTGTPDLSLSAREELGGYGYFATDKWVGRPLNSGFGFADRTSDHGRVQNINYER